MKTQHLSRIIIIPALLLHLMMLANLMAHFRLDSIIPMRWIPVQRSISIPDHWNKDAGGRGPFLQTEIPYFDGKLKKLKDHIIATKSLMAVPARETDNFGLDLWVRDSTRTDPGGDFFQIYRAGHDLRMGTSIFENYPPDMDTDAKLKLDELAPFHPPNRYPPSFIYTAGFFLSFLDPWNAYLFWVLLHEMALAYCILLTWRIRTNHPVLRSVACVMWLVFLPWYLELYMGQTTFLIMTATAALMSWSATGRHSVSTFIWWTVSLITKPISLLYTPVLIRMRMWLFAVSGIGISLISSSIYFLQNPKDALVFTQWAFGQEMVSSLGNFCFQNLAYHVFFSDTVTLIITSVLIFAGLSATFFIRPFDPVRMISLWTVIYFLGYAHVWQHHLVLLLPACIFPMMVSSRFRFLIPWLLATAPSPFYWFEGHWNWVREMMYISSGVAPVVTLLVLLLSGTLAGSNWKATDET